MHHICISMEYAGDLVWIGHTNQRLNRLYTDRLLAIRAITVPHLQQGAMDIHSWGICSHVPAFQWEVRRTIGLG